MVVRQIQQVALTEALAAEQETLHQPLVAEQLDKDLAEDLLVVLEQQAGEVEGAQEQLAEIEQRGLVVLVELDLLAPLLERQ